MATYEVGVTLSQKINLYIPVEADSPEEAVLWVRDTYEGQEAIEDAFESNDQASAGENWRFEELWNIEVLEAEEVDDLEEA